MPTLNIDLSAIKCIPCHAKNHGGSRPAGQIKYLVYHYTGNDGDTAKANANYYQSTVVQASAHYFVDDDNVICSVDPLTTAWAVGGSKWSDCAKTGGGTLYTVVTNANSISIEMCDTKKNGQLMATEATLERAAALGRALMKKYNIPIQRVVRHFDVTGKYCPAYFMDSAKWNEFKKRLVEEKSEAKQEAKPKVKEQENKEEEMDQSKFDAMMANYLERQAQAAPGQWSQAARQWAQERGIVTGSDKGLAYQAPCTREQVVTMLYRMSQGGK